MTPIHIDFFEYRRWVWVYAGALAICFAMGSAFALHWRFMQRSIQTERQDIAALQSRLYQSKKPVPIKPDQRYASTLKAIHQLNMDLNPAFAAAENLKINGVQLTGFVLDVGAEKLRLDYEVESLSKAAQVTEMLNAGNESKPWKMESVTGSTAANSMNSSTLVTSPVQTSLGLAYKGIWTTGLQPIL
jgi:hypothetical protein